MNRVRDLGTIEGPLLVFGGPYSNLEATEALLDAAQNAGIPTGSILCTGDVCAYCGDPQATADLLREAGITVVQGNCDENLGSEGGSCGCGFGDGTACDALSQQWYAYAEAHVDIAAKAWMASLPTALTFFLAGRRFRVVHGGVWQVNRFLYASTPESELAAELDAANADAVIAGHCGLPFTREVADGRIWHNAGVIGMPANDGTPRVWYSVIEASKDGIAFRHHPLDYDFVTAARKMRERGLPEGYARALETGLWPSLDSLLEKEREETGEALVSEPVHWQGRAKISV